MADQRENLTNKRGKPLGSGTTNATRKANRAHLQWANLAALGDPDTVESLEAHVQALEKARAKAEQKKALLEKTRSAPASGCASSSVKPPAALEKAAPAALEKAQGSGDGDSYSYYSSSPSTSTENERPKAKAKPHPKGTEPFLPKQELGATQENQEKKDEALGDIHHQLERPGKNGEKRNALEKAKGACTWHCAEASPRPRRLWKRSSPRPRRLWKRSPHPHP